MQSENYYHKDYLDHTNSSDSDATPDYFLTTPFHRSHHSSETMEFESTCSLMKSTSDRERSSSKMPKGLDLEISHHPLTMKRVVNLVIAMERLKGSGSESALSSEFRDEDLLNILLESAMEEQLVLEVYSEPPAERGSGFRRTGEEQCTVTDTNERSWVLVQETLQLHAVMLQGGNTHRKVHLNMTTYVNPAPVTGGRPVALGIRGTNYYLSCSMDAGKQTLHLEEYTGQLTSINKNSDLVRFLFYRRDTGVDASTLMSARFTDWYISTSAENDRPVAISHRNANRYKTFTIHRQSSKL